MTPLVSVILVSYNTSELTIKSIKSVFASHGFKKGQLEVIVVDNNSSDDTVNAIGTQFENFRLIVNDSNTGFGHANNQGAAIAQGEYLLLLNTDAFLSPDSLKILLDTLAHHTDVASVAPRLVSPDGSIQQSFGYQPTPYRLTGWMWGLDKLPLIKKLFPTPYHAYDLTQYKKTMYPGWLMGACVLFRKSEYLEVGGFDEKIFMYSEEVELYQRLSDKFGKKLLYTPKTQVVHLGSASSKKAATSRLVYELLGIEYIYQKHFPHLLGYIEFVLYTGVIMRIIIFSLIKSKRELVPEYLKYFQRSK